MDKALRSERRDEVKMHRLLDLEKREYYARYCHYQDYAWMHVGALGFPFPFSRSLLRTVSSRRLSSCDDWTTFILVVRHDRPRSRAWHDGSASWSRSRNSLATFSDLSASAHQAHQQEYSVWKKGEEWDWGTAEVRLQAINISRQSLWYHTITGIVWKRKPHVTRFAYSSSPLRFLILLRYCLPCSLISSWLTHFLYWIAIRNEECSHSIISTLNRNHLNP